jgi:hypothetical protein
MACLSPRRSLGLDASEGTRDRAEPAVVGEPGLVGVVDVFVRATHEVPTHLDHLLERHAAEQDRPCGLSDVEVQHVPAGGEVPEVSRG